MGASFKKLGGSEEGGWKGLDRAESPRLAFRGGRVFVGRGANAEGWSVDMSLEGSWLSDGLLGRGGGCFLSLLPSLFRSPCAAIGSRDCVAPILSFCRRSRKASMPSFEFGCVGNGGGGILVASAPIFGRAGKPTLRFE